MTRLELALAATTAGFAAAWFYQWGQVAKWESLFRSADRLAKLHYERADHAGSGLGAARDDLATALASAAGSLHSAANQFASIRESQAAGHTPRIDHNPDLFAKRAELAEQVLAAHGYKSSPAPATTGRPLIPWAVVSAPPARPVAGEDPPQTSPAPVASGAGAFTAGGGASAGPGQGGDPSDTSPEPAGEDTAPGVSGSGEDVPDRRSDRLSDEELVLRCMGRYPDHEPHPSPYVRTCVRCLAVVSDGGDQ